MLLSTKYCGLEKEIRILATSPFGSPIVQSAREKLLFLFAVFQMDFKRCSNSVFSFFMTVYKRKEQKMVRGKIGGLQIKSNIKPYGQDREVV